MGSNWRSIMSLNGVAPVSSWDSFCTEFKEEVLPEIRKTLFGIAGLSVLHALAGITRQVTIIGKSVIQVASRAQVGVAATQFSAALFLPFFVKDLADNIWKLVAKDIFEHKLDHGLLVLGAVGDVAGGIADATEAFVTIGGVAVEAMSWAGPLMVAGAAVSAISWVIHGKGIYYTQKMLGEISAKNLSKEQFVGILRDEDNKYHLDQQCGINAKTQTKMLEVLEGASLDRVEEIRAGLAARIKSKEACHALGIVITLTGIIAATIFFATTLNPWVIAAAVTLGITYILLISKVAVEIHSNRKFQQILKLNKQLVDTHEVDFSDEERKGRVEALSETEKP